MPTGTFSYDLLCLVLDVIEKDNATLYQCSLANRDFNRAACRILYSQVAFSPEFESSGLQKDASLVISPLNFCQLPFNSLDRAPHSSHQPSFRKMHRTFKFFELEVIRRLEHFFSVLISHVSQDTSPRCP